MPFTIDFLHDGRVLEWDATADSAVATERDDYTPRYYVAARESDANIDLTALQSIYDQHPDVVAAKIVARHPGFRRDKEPVLAVDVSHIDRVTSLAQQARQLNAYPVGDLACFNVDFSRKFRYCLEEDVDPTPARSRSISEKWLAMTSSSYAVSRLASGRPRRLSRMSSGIVSNDSTRLGLRRPYSVVSKTPSSAFTLEQCPLNNSSNGIVSLSHSKGIRRTPRTWRH